MTHWSDVYPHEVTASALLLDGEIYNWKIGDQFWSEPGLVKMRLSDCRLIEEGRFTVENQSFTVHNDDEHRYAFEVLARQWFKNWKISDKHIGCACY